LIADDPGLVGDFHPVAYFGAMREHLARRRGLPIPAWVRDDARYRTTAWVFAGRGEPARRPALREPGRRPRPRDRHGP